MKLLSLPSLILFSAALISSSGLAQEARPAEFLDSLKEWKVAFPAELPGTAEIVSDAFEGKPALKIEVPEGASEAWKGKVAHPVALPAPGHYTLTFFAKIEPLDAALEVSVWGASAGQSKNIGPRQNFKLLPEWQECIYAFSADAADPSANITWGNLARSGRTFFIANIQLKKTD